MIEPVNVIINEINQAYYDSAEEIIKKRITYNYLRTRIAESQNWHCAYCGIVMNTILNDRASVTLDHYIPRSEGGKDDYDNVIAACKQCNSVRCSVNAEYFYEQIKLGNKVDCLTPIERIEVNINRHLKSALKKFSDTNSGEFKKWLTTIPGNVEYKEEIVNRFNQRIVEHGL